MREIHEINLDIQREVLRMSRLIIIGWTVAIFAITSGAYVALDNLETKYAQEDRV